MGESVQVEGRTLGSTAERTGMPGGCCGAPAAVAVVNEPVVSTPCCGSSAEAEAEGSCCGAAAKGAAVASGAGCCG
jgi:hypothetical protein